MFKTFFLFFFLIFYPIVSFGMEEETPFPSPSQKIYFPPDLLKENTTYQLHFFWTSGVRIEDCTPKGLQAPVYIGGHAYSEGFREFLASFLAIPHAPSVCFVTDPRTIHGNPWLREFEACYPRLKLFLIEKVVEQIIQEVQELKRQKDFSDEDEFFQSVPEMIRSLFANADRGNPAIASDLYRLLMKGCGPFQESRIHRVYCDVDTFVHGIEKAPQIFFKALFLTPNDSKIARQAGANDVVSFEWCSTEGTSSWFDNFRQKLLKKLEADSDFFRFCNYFLVRYELLQKMSGGGEYDRVLDGLGNLYVPTWDIMYTTGPGLLNRLGGVCESTLQYTSVCALSWTPLCSLLGKLHLPLTTPALENLFQSYVRVMEYALVAQKWGEDHLAFIFLRQYLKNNNPFLTEAYKGSLQEYICWKKEQDQVLSKASPEMLALLEGINPADLVPKNMSDEDLIDEYFDELMKPRSERSFNSYPQICRALKNFGIDFKLTKEDLKQILGLSGKGK